MSHPEFLNVSVKEIYMGIIHHPLRFVMGLYPIMGLVVGIIIYNLYPYYFIGSIIGIFSIWIIYESIIDYTEYHEKWIVIIINAIGVPACISIYLIMSYGFPKIIIINTVILSALIYFLVYILLGIIINIKYLK